MTIEREGLLPHKIILRSPYIYYIYLDILVYRIYSIYIFLSVEDYLADLGRC